MNIKNDWSFLVVCKCYGDSLNVWWWGEDCRDLETIICAKDNIIAKKVEVEYASVDRMKIVNGMFS
jgi:hypothetical protein